MKRNRTKPIKTIEDLLSQLHPFGDGCLCWPGAKTDNGYAKAKVNGKLYRLHRYAYEQHHGPIPLGMVVMHTCDNRLCCNPEHLALGTSADNSADMVAKGRSARGEQHGRSKLTPEQVLEIQRDYIPRHPVCGNAALAKRYGVDPSTISYARSGRNFAYADRTS